MQLKKWRKDLGKNEAKWTRKVDISKVEFLAADDACKVIFEPTPSL